MRKFTSLILCLFLIFILGTFLGCKKKEPVPEERATSWMATEDESQYSEMAWEAQAGEEQEEEIAIPEEPEEPSQEEEYEEGQGKEPYPYEPPSEEPEEF